MVLRWAVNAGLLAIPIGATVGVLVGIESHRQATGQGPLFSSGGDGNPGNGGSSTGGTGGGGGGTTVGNGNGITISQYCQASYGISPPAKGTEYTLNPNQWGWTEGQPGALCMNITTFNNETYATTTTAPEFTVTWQYPQGPESQPVHAFPNIRLEGSVLPATLQTVSQMNLGLEWSYAVGNEPAASTDAQALTGVDLNGNVAIDMFIDSDKTSAQNSSKAKYEVMVWFADFGAAAQPIGQEKGVAATQQVNGTTFSLYSGQNGLGQNVLTWLASGTVETFNGDISPLVTKLSTLNLADFPAESDYLGYWSFGSEAFSSNANVTFSVPSLSVDIQA